MDDFEMEYDLLGWPENLAALQERLTRTQLPAKVMDALVATARPALMLEPVAVTEDEIPLGATKIGGRPDVPSEFIWPMRPPYSDAREAADRALDYGGQLMALAGLAPPWMTPAKGQKFIEKTLRAREKLARDLEEMREESRQELAELENDNSLTDEDRQMYRDMLETEAFDLDPIPTQAKAEAAGRSAEMIAQALTGDFPLAFIAQIDFASLANEPGLDPALPKTGRLYLFYDLLGLPDATDPASKPGFHAIYDVAGGTDLVRMDLPPALAVMEPMVPQAILAPAAVRTRPALSTPTLEACGYIGLRLRQAQIDRYDEWLVDEVGWPGQPERDRHQLGGWPRAIQANMQTFSQLASKGVNASTLADWKGKKVKALLADAGQWHLLFQLGPDDAGDAILPGSINFLIRDEDLAECRFDRIWAVYEQS